MTFYYFYGRKFQSDLIYFEKIINFNSILTPLGKHLKLYSTLSRFMGFNEITICAIGQ